MREREGTLDEVVHFLLRVNSMLVITSIQYKHITSLLPTLDQFHAVHQLGSQLSEKNRIGIGTTPWFENHSSHITQSYSPPGCHCITLSIPSPLEATFMYNPARSSAFIRCASNHHIGSSIDSLQDHVFR